MKPGSIIHWNSLFLIASTSYAYSLASHSNFLRAVAPFTRKELTRLNLSEDDAPDDDGRELAEKFYEQMRKRQEQTSSNNNSSRDDETYEVVSRNRSGARRKFTGRRGERDSTGTPSAGLFSSQSGSIYAIDTGKRSSFTRKGGGDSTPRDSMLRDEINFMNVASNETTIVIQGFFVLLLLGFTLYVGFNGGITDGAERFGNLPNEFNGLGVESFDFTNIRIDTDAVEGSQAASVFI
jgi:hypothetical protein